MIPRDAYHDRHLVLACGNCRKCRIRKASDWKVRLFCEAQLHDDASFVTLTYDNQHEPEGSTLVKDDYQKFLKRLRKHFKGTKIAYLIVGEYGPKTLRPHYHLILFGITFPDPDQVRGGEQPLFKSQVLSDLWGLGEANYSPVSTATIGYLAGYSIKKLTGERADDAYTRYDADGRVYSVLPEFQHMSLKPAVGLRWLEKHYNTVYPHDFIVIDGKKKAPPKYFDRWLEREHPALWKRVRSARLKRGIESESRGNRQRERQDASETILEQRHREAARRRGLL